MAVFTQLSPADVAEIAERFRLGTVRGTTAIEAGTINSNYRFAAQAGRFFVRVNEGKTRGDVARVAAIVTRLFERGVPTPLPVVATDGQPLAQCACGIVSVFPWVAGCHVTLADRTASHLGEVGRALALVHTAGADDLVCAESSFAFSQVVAGLDGLRRECTDDAVAPVLEDLAAELVWQRSQVSADVPVGLIHGDLFPDNVLFDGDRLCALLDFEQAARESFVYDVAVCLLSWCFAEDFQPHLVAAFIAGYQSVRPLAPGEVEQLFMQARAVAVRFTITRITDVHLNPDASALVRQTKDFRRFHRRLQRLRELGRSGLAGLLFA